MVEEVRKDLLREMPIQEASSFKVLTDTGLTSAKNHGRKEKDCVELARKFFDEHMGPEGAKFAVRTLYYEMCVAPAEVAAAPVSDTQTLSQYQYNKAVDALSAAVPPLEAAPQDPSAAAAADPVKEKSRAVEAFVQAIPPQQLANMIDQPGNFCAGILRTRACLQFRKEIEAHWKPARLLHIKLQNLITKRKWTKIRRIVSGKRNADGQWEVCVSPSSGVAFPAFLSAGALSKFQKMLLEDVKMKRTMKGESVRIDLDTCIRKDILSKIPGARSRQDYCS